MTERLHELDRRLDSLSEWAASEIRALRVKVQEQAQWIADHPVDPKHRSTKEHRLLFAIIRRAAEQWPHPLEGGSIDEQAAWLRGWLEVEAGHTEQIDIEGAENLTVPVVKSAKAFLRGSTGYLRMVRIPGGLRIIRPASIKYEEMGKKDFQALADRIYEIIEVEIGVPVAQLKKERDAA